jgi:hypothetical protein
MVILVVAGLFAALAVALWYLTPNSRKVSKLTARIAAGLLTFASVLTLLFFLSAGLMCGERDYAPVLSSDGKRLAQASEFDCGAVDHFHSRVELWQKRQGFFAHILGKRARRTTVFTVGHDASLIDLVWKDNETLVIHFPNDSRYLNEYRCKTEWDGVQIECVGYLPDYTKPVAQVPTVHRWFW